IRKSLQATQALVEESASDAAMKALAEEELKTLEERREQVEGELKVLLLPKDPNDEKNVVLEIRAGSGGDEASLFAQEVFRMYSRCAESQGWRVEVLSTSLSGVGGLKEVIALIEGKKVYSRLRFESGVHRVQRVPATEQQGRIHTSAVTVAVLPEADEVEIEMTRRKSALTRFVLRGRAGSPSIPPIPRCASRTFRRGWWFPARTRSRKSRTAPRQCACCARGCSRRSARSSRNRSARSGARRSARATAAKRSAPITSRKTASPTTASA